MTLTSFDLGVHAYVEHTATWLETNFGAGRHKLILGNSKRSLPSAVAMGTLSRCDLVFVDGGHLFSLAFNDALHFAKASTTSTRVLMDDCPYLMGGAWAALCDQGVVECEQPRGTPPRAAWSARNSGGEQKQICEGRFTHAAIEASAGGGSTALGAPGASILTSVQSIIAAPSTPRGVGVCRDVEPFSNCEEGLLGSWILPAETNSLEACVTRCLGCAKCRYVSYSQARRDCSWYAECDLDQLLTYDGWVYAQGRSYTSMEVKKENAD